MPLFVAARGWGGEKQAAGPSQTSRPQRLLPVLLHPTAPQTPKPCPPHTRQRASKSPLSAKGSCCWQCWGKIFVLGHPHVLGVTLLLLSLNLALGLALEPHLLGVFLVCVGPCLPSPHVPVALFPSVSSSLIFRGSAAAGLLVATPRRGPWRLDLPEQEGSVFNCSWPCLPPW